LQQFTATAMCLRSSQLLKWWTNSDHWFMKDKDIRYTTCYSTMAAPCWSIIWKSI